MNKITSLICVLLIFGCASTQSNIKINSVDTFNLDNYSDFYININDSFLSAEIDPIELEKFSNNVDVCKCLTIPGTTYRQQYYERPGNATQVTIEV